ncbi:MAG: hypothetical protein Tsb0020_39340 [Haliangiales bacterium]
MSKNGPGYSFVPLPPTVRRESRPGDRHDRHCEGTLSGSIVITLATDSPVHVGSGHLVLVDQHIVSNTSKVRGHLGVPGSSLKGVLRSRYEAITLSCVPLYTDRDRVKSRSREDIEHAHFSNQVRRHPALAKGPSACSPHKLCPACALFGRMSLRSRVSVLDFACNANTVPAIALIPARFSPRLHHIGDIEVGSDRGRKSFELTSLHGRKFAAGQTPIPDDAKYHRLAVIPAGAELTGELRLFNLSPAELGGLLAALGHLPQGRILIGGGKGHGLGRAHVKTVQYRLRDSAGHDIEPDEAGWRDAFTTSPDRFSDGEDKLFALHQRYSPPVNTRPVPTERAAQTQTTRASIRPTGSDFDRLTEAARSFDASSNSRSFLAEAANCLRQTGDPLAPLELLVAMLGSPHASSDTQKPALRAIGTWLDRRLTREPDIPCARLAWELGWLQRLVSINAKFKQNASIDQRRQGPQGHRRHSRRQRRDQDEAPFGRFIPQLRKRRRELLAGASADHERKAADTAAATPTTLPDPCLAQLADIKTARAAWKRANDRKKRGKPAKDKLLAIHPVIEADPDTQPAYRALAEDIRLSLLNTEGVKTLFDRTEAAGGKLMPFWIADADLEHQGEHRVAKRIYHTRPESSSG